MVVQREVTGVSTLAAFGLEHGLELEVRQCPWGIATSFRSSEVRDGTHMLLSSYGAGGTESESACDYARRISGALLVVNAMLDTRREIRVPLLVEEDA